MLGQVECSDGSFYSLRATVHGKLVEVRAGLDGGKHATWSMQLQVLGTADMARTLTACLSARCLLLLVCQVNESLGKRAQSMVDMAAWEGFLALFMLAPRAKTLLSVEDRLLEGSEAERDTSEARRLRTEQEVPAAAAAATTAQASGAPEEESVDAQVAAQREGRAWQSVIEYLTPQQYQEKRKALFVPT